VPPPPVFDIYIFYIAPKIILLQTVFSYHTIYFFYGGRCGSLDRSFDTLFIKIKLNIVLHFKYINDVGT
jgi:hypothetical protein